MLNEAKSICEFNDTEFMEYLMKLSRLAHCIRCDWKSHFIKTVVGTCNGLIYHLLDLIHK